MCVAGDAVMIVSSLQRQYIEVMSVAFIKRARAILKYLVHFVMVVIFVESCPLWKRTSLEQQEVLCRTRE